MEIKNDLQELDVVCDKVNAFCAEHNLSERYHDIVLILDELITNIVSYAYPEGGEHIFSLKIERCDDKICICLTDDGIPFDPSSLSSPDTESSLEERKVGGLGIFLVRQLSEALEYSRVDNKNQLLIKVSVEKKEE
ncbi:MAG: ATP-binding protein [Holosporaceae bacterium]|nr:ATP-binding protein [Holosporaceae bacterium]